MKMPDCSALISLILEQTRLDLGKPRADLLSVRPQIDSGHAGAP